MSPILLAPVPPRIVHHSSAFACRIIPVELLEEIFRFYLAEPTAPVFLTMLSCAHTLEPPPTASFLPQRRSTLRSVCRYWCDVMHQATSLWTALILLPGMNYSVFTSLLSRSRHRRLTITAYYHNIPHSAHATSSEPSSHTDTELLGLAQAFRQLNAEAARWDSLTVYAEESSIISVICRAAHSNMAVASMTTIRLLCTSNLVYPAPTTYIDHVPFPPASALPSNHVLNTKSLSFRACRIDWLRITPFFSEVLLELTLDYPLAPVMACRLFELLSFAPNLESIRIAGNFISEPAFPSMTPSPEGVAPVTLSCLHTLALSAMSVYNAQLILDRIRAPKLRAAWLDVYIGLVFHDEPDYGPLVTQIMDGTSHIPWHLITSLSLRALPLRIPVRHCPDASRFFHLFPAVHDLSLNFVHLQREYWKWLLVSCAEGALPELQSVTLAGVAGLDVQDFVCVRMRAGLPSLHLVVVLPPSRCKLENISQWSVWLRRRTRSLHIVEHDDRTFF